MKITHGQIGIKKLSGMGHGVVFRAVFDSGVWMQWRQKNMMEMGNRSRTERHERCLIVCPLRGHTLDAVRDCYERNPTAD